MTALPAVFVATEIGQRRIEVDSLQEWIASFLESQEADALLCLDPADFHWLTAGGELCGVYQPSDHPVLYFTAGQRWVFCGNQDTQRLFDEELDALGFQLKEWHWSGSREQLLMECCQGKRIVADVPWRDHRNVGTQLASRRRLHSARALTLLRRTAELLNRTLEAAGRTIERGESELDAVAQLVHRLLKNGLSVVEASVVDAERCSRYPRLGSRAYPLQSSAVLSATVRRHGLHLSASRTVSFEAPSTALRTNYDRGCRLMTRWLAGTQNGRLIASAFESGRKILRDSDMEHAWRHAPPGYFIGSAPIEGYFLPTGPDTFRKDEALVWQARLGPAVVTTAVAVTDDLPVGLSPVENWPTKRMKIADALFDLPDILCR